ncbi:hypothetical protein ACLESD_03295, partial [Pyxidicoccus sp. 3LFB2]
MDGGACLLEVTEGLKLLGRVRPAPPHERQVARPVLDEPARGQEPETAEAPVTRYVPSPTSVGGGS